MHALIVGRGEDRWTPEGHQILGFRMYAGDLLRTLGMTFEIARAETLADVEAAVAGRPADVAFVMVSWKEDPAEVEALFRRLSGRPGRPRLVFLDYYAPASSPFFGVLPHVDCYLKRQMYRDPSLYLEELAGGTLLTDRVSGAMGIDLRGWRFASRPDPAHLHKLVHGWNLGVAEHYRWLLRLSAAMPLPWRLRPFAVNCRLGTGDGDEWYQLYRRRWAEALASLGREFRRTGAERVRRRQYFGEMILSRAVVSPFGWGEVCFRDYEAVACGALLVKPSMSHLRTSPDIYVDGKTYVAASWDAGDVREVCRHYLAHPEQAEEIVHNARVALSGYFEDGGFVEDVRRVLRVAGLEPGLVPIPSPARPANRVPIMV